MKWMIAFAVFAPASAFAHGSLPHQASAAIEKAGEIWASQPPDVRRAFASVSAVKTGHDQFDVTIVLTNDTKFAYDCKENESVDPVVWECAAK